jgi:hypothetical protein
MVRRDETEGAARLTGDKTVSRCASPAGASPAPVSAGAPGSRPHLLGGDLDGRAGCRKPVKRREPCSGEQARGPQHEVKPAASTDKQSGSRAAHVTAKATPAAQRPEGAAGPGGVWGAARVQGGVRNTGDPSAPPSSRQGGSYKSKTKSSAAQRESEGLVVPRRVVTNNATGGKGPCFGHARTEGNREGMAAESGPNNPGARRCDVKVRQPRGELWAGAKLRGATRPSKDFRRRADNRLCLLERNATPGAQAPSRRPSVSRVPEIGTHGLKGGPALSPMIHCR